MASVGPWRTAVSTTGVEQQTRLDPRPFAVTCGDERAKEPEGLVLSRARLKATILLSVGSEPGEYEVQVLDADLKSRASSTASAAHVKLRDHARGYARHQRTPAGHLSAGRAASR